MTNVNSFVQSYRQASVKPPLQGPHFNEAEAFQQAVSLGSSLSSQRGADQLLFSGKDTDKSGMPPPPKASDRIIPQPSQNLLPVLMAQDGALIKSAQRTLKRNAIKIILKEKIPFLSVNPEKEKAILTHKIWNNVMAPFLEDTEKAKKTLQLWQTEVEKANIEPPMIKELAVNVLREFRKNADNKDAILGVVEILSLFLVNGGYSKIKSATDAMKTDAYKGTTDNVVRGKLLLESQGAIFMKLFQALSTVPGLLDRETMDSMDTLLEDVSPIPYELIAKQIKKEFGKPVEQVFESFEKEHLKAGTIAQVHRARYNGQVVAVKVVKPGVEKEIEHDFKMLEAFVDFVGFIYPEFKPREFFDDFAARFKNETNMRLMPNDPEGTPMGESDMLKAIDKIFKEQNAQNVVVPEVYDDRTTKNVLTMEFLKGKSLFALSQDPTQTDQQRYDLAFDYLTLVLKQVFAYGASQADPHAGNFLYQQDKKMFGLIDAGLVFISEKEERVNFLKILMAIYVSNPDLIAEAMAKDYKNQPEYQAFRKNLKDIVRQVDVEVKSMNASDSEKTARRFLETYGRAVFEGKQLGMDVKVIDPMLLKTLFTALTQAQKLHPDVNLTRPVIYEVGKFGLDNLLQKQEDIDFVTKLLVLVAADKLGDLIGGIGGAAGGLSEKAGDKVGDNRVGRFLKRVGETVSGRSDDIGDVVTSVGETAGEVAHDAIGDKVAKTGEKVRGAIDKPGDNWEDWKRNRIEKKLDEQKGASSSSNDAIKTKPSTGIDKNELKTARNSGLEFYGGGEPANGMVVTQFNTEYARIPKNVQRLLKKNDVRIILTTNGTKVSDWLRDYAGTETPDLPQWRERDNVVLIPDTWPMHDKAGQLGSGSVVTHELGHAVDSLLGRPSRSDDFRSLIDRLANDKSWPWADYGDGDVFSLKTRKSTVSDPAKRKYNEIFARAFDDYTDATHSDRVPMPDTLNYYFDRLLA